MKSPLSITLFFIRPEKRRRGGKKEWGRRLAGSPTFTESEKKKITVGVILLRRGKRGIDSVLSLLLSSNTSGKREKRRECPSDS